MKTPHRRAAKYHVIPVKLALYHTVQGLSQQLVSRERVGQARGPPGGSTTHRESSDLSKHPASAEGYHGSGDIIRGHDSKDFGEFS